MRMKKRKTAVFACVIVLFFCAILLGLCWGSYEISCMRSLRRCLKWNQNTEYGNFWNPFTAYPAWYFCGGRTCDIGRCFTDNDKE